MPKLLALCGSLTNSDIENGGAFKGGSGAALKQYFSRVGLPVDECQFAAIFPFRIEAGSFKAGDPRNLCGPRGTSYFELPPFAKGKYLQYIHAKHIERLVTLVELTRPNLILGFGDVASWVLLDDSKISTTRGMVAWSDRFNCKVLCTNTHSAVIGQGNMLPVLLRDLSKAAREMQSPTITRPRRLIYIEPTIADLYSFEEQFINATDEISIDIETIGEQITMMSFAPDPHNCLVVPFYDNTKADANYWPDLKTELAAWEWVRKICGLKKSVFVGQNFGYDMMFTLTNYGITFPSANHDTMLLHHAMQPELKKGLGFLASIYTDELSWKFMRPKHTAADEDV